MGLYTKLYSFSPENFSNETVFFRLITDEDDLAYAIFECQLDDAQKELVNPAGFSIGRAFLRPEDNFPCVICSVDGQRVGFINLCVWLGQGDAYSWSYYIDKEHQGKGYGRSAAMLTVRLLKAVDGCKAIKIATEKENVRAQKLYRSLGALAGAFVAIMLI